MSSFPVNKSLSNNSLQPTADAAAELRRWMKGVILLDGVSELMFSQK